MDLREPARTSVPSDYSAENTSRRWSDPCPSYFHERHRLPPSVRDELLDFFNKWKPDKKPKPESLNPAKPEGGKPEPEIPKPELIKKLHVKSLDLLVDDNTAAHNTNMYKCTEARKNAEGKQLPAELVVRRGQEFKMIINFDRPYNIEKNDITLIFKLGNGSRGGRKLAQKFKLQETKPASLEKGKWSAYLTEKKDKSMTVAVFIPASAAAGEWELNIRTIVDEKDGKKEIWQYIHNQEVIVLFNPWCTEDVFYMKDQEWLKEAVLNDHGVIYQGSYDWMGYKKWHFGQFEDGILEVCLHLLRKAFGKDATPAMGKGFRVVRALSKIVNSNDDAGVLSGNWSGEYGDGTSPMKWKGSVKILEEYAKTDWPVKYGQCWVFSGVLTTVCRALGIPCRSVTNFESAHNSDLCHLSSDIINKHNSDGWYEERTDSIWNFHVWNEVWMSRPDLGTGYDGWQVIDATPQELSEGVFQCGPSPLTAIKEGEITVGDDTAFIFAEVNGDKIEWAEDPETKVLYVMERETAAIGKRISTHKPTGEPVEAADIERLDITNLYKYEEGTQKEREIVAKAEKTYRCVNFGEDPDNKFPKVVALEVKIKRPEKLSVGECIPFTVEVQNKGDTNSTITISIELLWVDYRRRDRGTILKTTTPEIIVKPKSKTEKKVEIDVPSTLKMPNYSFNFKCSVVVDIKELGLSKKKSDVVRLTKPELEVSGPKKANIGDKIKLDVKMTNPLSQPLTECEFTMDGGLKPVDGVDTIKVGTIKAKGTFTKTLTLEVSESPRFRPWRGVEFNLLSKELGDIEGSHRLSTK